MRLVVLALALALAIPGCTVSQRTTQGPTGQSTEQSAFGQYQKTEQWSVPSPTPETGSFDNGFPRAFVQLSGQIGPGQFTLRVLDGDGAVVYGITVNGPGNVVDESESQPGEPGSWTVETTKAAVTGNVVVQIASYP